ncbi:MAG: efflux RND transporter periplasmic adaptor subunit [Muribaculaceae bacterium]|nr:efflux RND transporter periplasmic adaptor subunit [Muribaculaceae bacterium]
MKYLNIIAATTVSLLTLSVSCGKKQDTQQQQAPELAVLTISQSDAVVNSEFPCTLEGENDVEIRPQISGFLTKVCVTEGQNVTKGQILFQIDQVSLQAAVDAAAAQVQVAQANVNTAQTNVNNNKILLDKNIIGAPAYQTSVDALNSAKALLNQANANLVSARKNLSYSTVTAPVSGVVGTIDYKEGTLVSPSTLLTILSNNGDMQALISLNEKELLALTNNGSRTIKQAIDSLPPVSLQLANGEIYGQQGKIVSISGVLDQNTGSAQAKAIFPNPSGMLRSGNTGKVLLPNTFDGSILVPQNATFEVQDLKFVFVVNDSSIVHQRPIQVSQNSDGKNYIVTDGLKPGERIVVEGVGISVKDGMMITPKK